LIGNRDIEDSLERLDKLTQEEAQMASAEQLKKVMGVGSQAQDVGGDVRDVGDKVQSVDDKVQSVGDMVQSVGDKLDQANRSLSPNPNHHSGGSDTITGNQLRDSLFRWLSPPSLSTNHNIACKAHHDGTAQWFFQGSIFNQWKSAGSFLWVHGKRVLLLTFAM